ncbi:MAG: coproporphyrinogen III oxidase, partial [Planctomycetales bacterium]|nr:coproporphyrinogen III oxidase [Planctomycetales bacterium]
SGSDLIATGVASFGHISGVHYQNNAEWAGYLGAIESGELPLMRGLKATPHQLLVREVILLLKRGYLDGDYFHHKFGVDILEEWSDVWRQYAEDGLLTVAAGDVRLTRKGLLEVDGMLPAFFEGAHQGVRYT